MTSNVEGPLSKCPKQAFFYFPTGCELIAYNSKNPQKSERKIFEGAVEFFPYEIEMINNLYYEMNNLHEAERLRLPPDWKDSDTLRFLQAARFGLDETIKLLKKHMEWRQKYLPPQLTDNAQKALTNGSIYCFGRDHRFRPIMVIDSRNYYRHRKQISSSDFERACVYLLEYMLKNLLIPGQVEQWNLIFSMEKVGVFNFPKELGATLYRLMNNYNWRLHKIFMLKIGTLSNIMWKIINSTLTEDTQEKIKVISKSNPYEIFRVINPDQVESKHYGSVPDVDYPNFFPPWDPSSNYLLPGEDASSLLIDESDYLELVEENLHISENPYLKLIREKVAAEEEYEEPQAYYQEDRDMAAIQEQGSAEVSDYRVCEEYHQNLAETEEPCSEEEEYYVKDYNVEEVPEDNMPYEQQITPQGDAFVNRDVLESQKGIEEGINPEQSQGLYSQSIKSAKSMVPKLKSSRKVEGRKKLSAFSPEEKLIQYDPERHKSQQLENYQTRLSKRPSRKYFPKTPVDLMEFEKNEHSKRKYDQTIKLEEDKKAVCCGVEMQKCLIF